MVTGHISVGSTSNVSMDYDRGLSTVLRAVVVVRPQPNVLNMPATPSSQDYERVSGLSSKNDDVLGHAANWG